MSVRSEIISLVEAVPAIGGRVYADEAPEGESLPYATVITGVSEAQAISGDARTEAWRAGGQVDVWERWEEEDGTLAQAVRNTLDGAKLSSALRLRVTGDTRNPPPKGQRLVQTTVLLTYARLR